MVYITGDKHGDFSSIIDFCNRNSTTTDEIMIILGDVGLNYYGDWRDDDLKSRVATLPMTFFCIHGNHENRPQNIDTYIKKKFMGGSVWYEEKYPNILFATDGDIYTFNGYRCIVIGGAYSIDKDYRRARGMKWFPDEQPSSIVKAYVENQLVECRHDVDVVLSHTCPYKYEPTEAFLPGIDQSKVDKSTEKWLGALEGWFDYKKWYCGHFHIDKSIDRLRFMFRDIDVFPTRQC